VVERTYIIGLRSINVSTLVQLCAGLQTPLLQRLTIALHGAKQKAVNFGRGIGGKVGASCFPNLESLQIHFDEGVRQVYDCRLLRDAFEDYDHLKIINFAPDVETIDGPQDK
jgi:hypothetical protein